MKGIRRSADQPTDDARKPVDVAEGLLGKRRARTRVEGALAHEYRFEDQLAHALTDDVPEQGFADALHEYLGLAVAVEDRFGGLLARAGPDHREPVHRTTRPERARLLDAARRVSGPLRVRDRLMSVAVSHGTVLGLIVVLDPRGTLEPSDKKAPESDATPASPRAGALHAIGLTTGALTLHLLHRRHLAQTELRLRHDLVETVLLEPREDDLADEVDRRVGRASALDHDLTGPHRVIALHPPAGRWPDGETVGELVDHAARSLSMPYLGTLRGQTAVLVCATPGGWLDSGGQTLAPWSGRDRQGDRGDGRPDERRASCAVPWQDLHDAFAHVLLEDPAIGVGGFVDRPEHLPRSYREAMQALTVRMHQPDPRGLTTFEDLGLYRLLATPEGRREAGAFVDDWLGDLLGYDAERRADLVPTLGAYLDHGGNYDDTAAALHIHRSTLRYRLQRIRELSGHDLTHPDTRLNLHVAVRAAVVADSLAGDHGPPQA